MRQVRWSQAARRELLAITGYIAAANPSAARRVAERISDTAGGLARFALGRPGRISGTHEKVVVGLPYIIAYGIERQADGREVVMIYHVIHGARDWREGGWPQR